MYRSVFKSALLINRIASALTQTSIRGSSQSLKTATTAATTQRHSSCKHLHVSIMDGATSAAAPAVSESTSASHTAAAAFESVSPAAEQQAAKVIFVLGGPGAGKGTQCANIVSHYGYVHLSAGDLLRDERATPGSTHGALIDTMITNGEIVPVEITVMLIKAAMQRHISEHGAFSFLVDGFPRNHDNLEGWHKVMPLSFAVLQQVLYFNCNEAVMESRLLKRGETSGRSDDNAASILKRFRTYQQSTMPIIQHFQQQQLVTEISADQSVEAVFEDVKQAFTRINIQPATAAATTAAATTAA